MFLFIFSRSVAILSASARALCSSSALIVKVSHFCHSLQARYLYATCKNRDGVFADWCKKCFKEYKHLNSKVKNDKHFRECRLL